MALLVPTFNKLTQRLALYKPLSKPTNRLRNSPISKLVKKSKLWAPKSRLQSLYDSKRWYCSPSRAETGLDAANTSTEDVGPPSSQGVFQLGNVTPTDSHDRMLTLIFTCNICQKRSARQFSQHSYKKGVVIIQCPGCEKYHLIADHLGWFQEGKDIEEFMAKKGDTVRKITDASEITPEIQNYVNEAASERQASLERRKLYNQKREHERAELAAAEEERKQEEAKQVDNFFHPK